MLMTMSSSNLTFQLFVGSKGAKARATTRLGRVMKCWAKYLFGNVSTRHPNLFRRTDLTMITGATMVVT